MDTEMEKLIVAALEGTDYEVLAEHGGWSFYDRRLPVGKQMLANVPDIESLLLLVMHHCKFTRKCAPRGDDQDAWKKAARILLNALTEEGRKRVHGFSPNIAYPEACQLFDRAIKLDKA